MNRKETSKSPTELRKEIDFLRNRLAAIENKKKEHLVTEVAHGIAGETGDNFFQSIVKYITKNTELEYALIGERSSDGTFVETLAASQKGKLLPNFSYDLEGAPCQNVMGKETCLYASGVRERFPKDLLLVEMGIESYAGVPLFDSKDNPIGIIVALDTKPIKEKDRIKAMLKILAGRASSELERFRMERALIKSQSLLAEAQRIARIGTWEWDLAENKIRWSEFTAKLFKLPPGNEWRDYDVFSKHVHYENKDAVRNAVAAAINERKPIELEHRILLKDGTELFVKERAEIFFDKKKRPYRVLGTIQDLTNDKKRGEKALLAEKAESMAIVAGGIAHDFNNLLTSIMGNIGLSMEKIQKKDPSYEYLEHAYKAANAAIDLSRQLLTFSKGQPVENKELFQVEKLINDTTAFSLAGTSIKLKAEIIDGIWPLEAYKGQLSQVLINLLINASQSMKGSGDITVKASNAELNKDDVKGLPEGKYVSIAVTDSGPGIPEDYIKKIFEPYFTTKKHGSGLGLASCKTIMKKHGGAIAVESVVGSGTTFTLYIPASEKAITAQEAQEQKLQSGGNILIMEDETRIRVMMKKMLSALGYEATLAANGEEALDRYNELLSTGKRYDAVIMDLTVVGGMGAQETIKTLFKRDPRAKIILTTGYALDPMMKHYRQHGISAVLPKPFGLMELGKTLSQVIYAKY